ncbi:MAG: hypothetical protein Q8M03_14140 [Legionella sp.]|nr:hypothetical protein [Legionella sp.]
MNKHLVILSVPLIRIGRVLLGAPVLETIKETCDVLIVSPNEPDSDFQKEFSAKGVKFYQWIVPGMSALNRMLGTIVTIQRMNGYWLRHRHKGMGLEYYHRNAVYTGLDDCSLKKLSLLKIVIYRLIAWTGYFSVSWRITDSLRGFLFRDAAKIDNVTNGYEKVTLIQSCSWGEQDTYLAWYAKKKKIRTIFIPYTTDQLYCNGFLLSDYDAVCIQGEFEKKCATRLHALSELRQKNIGSAWFRHVDNLINEIDTNPENSVSDVKYILFSGHSAQYYPRESEYKALASLEKIVSARFPGKVKIIYRPVCMTADEIKKIQEDWGNRENIEIQLPQLSIVGTEKHVTKSLKEEWKDYIGQLQRADVLVMSFLSSLALDISYLGKPAFIVFDDATGKLEKKCISLLFDAEGKMPGLEAFPIINNIENIVPLLEEALKVPVNFSHLQKSVKKSWDFEKVNFREELAYLIDSNTGFKNETR